jgi:hypothetical protein
MRQLPETIETFEGKKGQGMCLSSTAFLLMQESSSKNRRALLDFSTAKKHKHFDEKEYLSEVVEKEER